jgi:adenylate cyclase
MIKSLRLRLILLLLVPVALLLFLTGFLGWLYARAVMLDGWSEASILKLERASHQLDMRLSRPSGWINMFHKTAGGRGAFAVQEWLLDQLRNMEGVTKVNLEWFDKRAETGPIEVPDRGYGMRGRGFMQFHRGKISQVTSPRLDARTGRETVDLISDLRDESGEVIGKLQVSLGFDYLMQDITKFGWWQSDLACLVDESGRYLAHTKGMHERAHLGETKDSLELAILKDMKEKPFGTFMGPGHPPEMVAGFYKITEAPWTIIMFAPGEKILHPIIQFRFYYFLAGSFLILVILLLIHLVGGTMVRSINELSYAANQVASGHYGHPLSVKSSDEMGQLLRSFNTMVEGLRERDLITNTFGRYVDQEFARELLKRPEAASLGGEKREVVILMSDIRGFTPLADSLKPEGTITILNHFFSHMIEPIQKHRGIIVDFFGDGLLVFFDPLVHPVEPVIRKALRCALDMQSSMNDLNVKLRAGSLPEFQMGIGINAGEVVVGNIGTEYRAKYGIVGSAVNLTHRIQAEARGGEVVISETVYGYSSQYVKIKRSFGTQLKGVKEETQLYVLDGMEG